MSLSLLTLHQRQVQSIVDDGLIKTNVGQRPKRPRVAIVVARYASQSNALIELKKDPIKNKAEISKLLATHSATFPAKLEAGKWYTLVVETVGDEMRVTIDGKPAGFLKSPGIGHATKSKIELGVAGKDGFFDDIKVWNAEAAKR